ncbi:MAG TPA: lipopolysaccharide assembly protein LapA domain-containing protein [Acidimicrobiales bacterium]|nr:lipopolysaccharide assembly protein LapA domain-containing protein [Acidimicrobiales bacterium]
MTTTGPELPAEQPVGGPAAEPTTAAAEPTSAATELQPPPRTAAHTRLSAAWTAVVVAVVILIFLVIFIAQNTQDSALNYLGAHGHAPTAVVILVAAIAGAVIVLVVGAARLVQLRRRARRVEKAGRPADGGGVRSA